MHDHTGTPRPDRRPTMVDVARAAGVSVKTVSRVANGVSTVDPELAARVSKAMAELGFQPNKMAASLRQGRNTATIGLIIVDLANPFYSAIAAAAAEVARHYSTQLITASSAWDPQREQELALDLCRRRVDGLIIVPTGDDQSYLSGETERGTPVVFIDRPPVGLQGDTVLIDNRLGMRTLVRRILSEGHRRVGVIVDSLNKYTMRERASGALEELAAAGVTEQAEVVEISSDLPRTAAEAVTELLDSPDPPTALLCGNNRILSGAVGRLARHRPRVRLAGFDDFEYAPLLPHPVTVVGYDTPALGRFAAELLFRRIQNPETSLSRTTISTYLADRGIDHLGGERAAHPESTPPADRNSDENAALPVAGGDLSPP